MTAGAKSDHEEDVLKPLDAAQALAVDPGEHVWLNASAGTGKTQVLSARVLRLLLGGVAPDAILCITYTKAGAAEMAHRVHERLALWVGCTDAALRTDLAAIGLDPLDRALQAHARTLFARVIDSPMGAIRVQTIHSFCQSLLASFPFEAGILPGFRLIEGGEVTDLRGAVLADLLGDTDGDTVGDVGGEGPLRREQFGRLSRRLGEDAALKFVDGAASYFQRRRDPHLAPPADAVRAALDLPQGDPDAWVAAQVAAGVIDDADIEQLFETAQGWLTQKGTVHQQAKPALEATTAWRAADAKDRLHLLALLRTGVATQDGELRAAFRKEDGKDMSAARDAAAAVLDTVQHLVLTQAACRLADDLSAGWSLAAAYAAALAYRKRAEGAAEFDDLIARTAALLANGELADWIRFKLDQRLDHLLIDEAQDTNADQWTIADGLTGEFWAGAGVRDDGRIPSMFTVGDRKQAIFGFQGTDPVAFEAARQQFLALGDASGRAFLPVDLSTNFRSVPAVLDFVDRWLTDGGVEAMGIAPPVARHTAFRGEQKAGRTEIWPPLVVAAKSDDDSADEDGEDSAASDDSLRAATDPASLKLAAALADQVKNWLDTGLDGAVVQPGDVMILVRTRRALAARIVAQLQSRGVPVAGVDRFKLAEPLAVQDLLAALRFMVQPDDEHSLAVLLVSPLIGWTNDQLYTETAARGRVPLRQWLAQSDTPLATAANARLAILRGAADLETPFRTLDRILSGPLRGRHAMAARLGAEANDAIDALLAEALAYETRGIASLTGFLDHIDRAPRDIKRPSGGSGLVRVMTVHGSKGLQAPIVILADATGVPSVTMLDVTADIAGWRALPLFRTAKDQRPPALEAAWDAARAAQGEEYWRLFYVAATRAQNLLVVTGTVRPKSSGEVVVPDDCWFTHAATALTALPHAAVDIGWESGPALRHGNSPGLWGKRPLGKGDDAASGHSAALVPDWARRTPPEEARPPRPLAPSQLGDDDAPQRPAQGDRAAAIQRGVMLHALIERLPGVDAAARGAAARHWLAAQVPDLLAPAQQAMADEACAVLAHPDWAAIFGPGSLAEAPFSAVIDGGIVVAGTVDRLLVTATAVLVVDYKTGAQVPADAAAVPAAYLRQMAAYAAALAVIFPGRNVAAALLYTAAPRLIALPADLLALHKPGLTREKANLGELRLELDGLTP